MDRKRKLDERVLIQKQRFLLDSVKQNRNRILFFLLFLLYALLTVLGTTDVDFLLENGIKFPLLNIELPLIEFYMITPIIIILVHFNLLSLYHEHLNLMNKHKYIKGFYNSMPLGLFDLPVVKSGKVFTAIRIFLYFIIYFFPLLILYIFWWHFNKYQDTTYSLIHIIYIAIDTTIIGFFLFKNKIGKFLSILACLVLIVSAIFQYAISKVERISQYVYEILDKREDIEIKLPVLDLNESNESSDEFFGIFNITFDDYKALLERLYPRLELEGKYLVNLKYDQLRTLESLNKDKPIILLQPPLNLQNRSFKYANFQGSLLARANFNGSNLIGANFSDSMLQGASFIGANMKNASFSYAKLEYTDFSGAILDGSNFIHTNLFHSTFIGSKLFDTDFSDSNVTGIVFYMAKFKRTRFEEFQVKNLDLTDEQHKNISVNELFLPDPKDFKKVTFNRNLTRQERIEYYKFLQEFLRKLETNRYKGLPR